MNDMKQMISKMHKEHSNECLREDDYDTCIRTHYMPEILYAYVKRRHFDTIKNGSYTNTVTMNVEECYKKKRGNPYDFIVTSDIMDCSPYASSISFKSKEFSLFEMSCLHIEFEFVCKHRIMMPFSKTIRRMMIHQYISRKSSPDTGNLIYGKFEGKDLDVIMKYANSITDIIDFIKEYMLPDPKDMNCWLKDNVTIDKYYEAVNEI